jgi:acyl-CoA thioesterase I
MGEGGARTHASWPFRLRRIPCDTGNDTADESTQEEDRVGERYVALGDSYTIGEGVAPDDRWPHQLVARLGTAGVDIDLVASPAVTGWTTTQLIEHGLPVLERSQSTFVTVLIGVNDWVQGIPIETFDKQLRHILDRTQAVLPDPRKVLLITIPDFSFTPKGPIYSRGRDISAGIAGFNMVIADVANERAVPVVDLFPVSRSLAGDLWTTLDGLHPSGRAYARWTDLIFPEALRVLLAYDGDSIGRVGARLRAARGVTSESDSSRGPGRC